MKDLVGEKATQPENHGPKLTKYLFKDRLWLQKYSAVLENGFRKMAREEVELAIQRSPLSIPRPLTGQIEPSGFRQYKLRFEGKLPSTLFTGNKVEAEGPFPVKILLLDAVSGRPITDGPLSSKKVKIVALQGHFKAEHLEEWTNENFCSHMVSKRTNKGSLLVGECVIDLQNGVGLVNDIFFSDNSSWVRSKMFRLGASVVAEDDQVREAVSSPFKVKDRRGEPYQKHDIPSLDDEVWRLCWIAKDGKICKNLEENHIYKVKDFITMYQTDEPLLRLIVGVSSKKWKAIVQHANSCFSGNAGLNPNNLAQNCIPFDNTINPISIPRSDQQQFCGTVQQEIQLSESRAWEHTRQLAVQTMALDNSLPENLFIGSPIDAGHPSLGYSMPSSSTTMLNDQTSSWLPDQYIWDAGV